MEFGVEGRKLVGRPRRTWLGSLEADMADLRSTKKWRRNVMKMKSKAIGKRVYNTNIVVYSQHPYCFVNNIVLTLFMKQSKFDVLICSLNLFHSHGVA